MGLDGFVGQLVVTLLEVDQGADAAVAMRVLYLKRVDETPKKASLPLAKASRRSMKNTWTTMKTLTKTTTA